MDKINQVTFTVPQHESYSQMKEFFLIVYFLRHALLLSTEAGVSASAYF